MVVRVVVDHAVAEAAAATSASGARRAARPASRAAAARIGHRGGMGRDRRRGRARPPTGTADGRPDGRSRRARRGGPAHDPAEIDEQGRRTVRGRDRRQRPAGQPRQEPDEERRPGRVRARRTAARGRPASGRGAGTGRRPRRAGPSRACWSSRKAGSSVAFETFRTKRSTPSTATAQLRSRSLGRARRVPGDPPALGEDRARPASDRRSGASARPRRDRSRAQAYRTRSGRPRSRNGSGEPAGRRGPRRPGGGPRPGARRRRRPSGASSIGSVAAPFGPGTWRTTRVPPGRSRSRDRNVSIARTSRSGAAPPKRTWSTWSGLALDLGGRRLPRRSATRSRASSGQGRLVVRLGAAGRDRRGQALRLDVGRDRLGRGDRGQAATLRRPGRRSRLGAQRRDARHAGADLVGSRSIAAALGRRPRPGAAPVVDVAGSGAGHRRRLGAITPTGSRPESRPAPAVGRRPSRSRSRPGRRSRCARRSRPGRRRRGARPRSPAATSRANASGPRATASSQSIARSASSETSSPRWSIRPATRRIAPSVQVADRLLVHPREDDDLDRALEVLERRDAHRRRSPS